MPHVQEFMKFVDNMTFVKEFFISTAQVLALFATPITVLAAPGAGLAIIFKGAMIDKPAGTAYAGVAAGEDLYFRYTDASGVIVGEVETTGFLDQVTDQVRYCAPLSAAAAPVSSFTPVANAVLKFGLLSGEITTGTSAILLRITYSIVPTDLSYITSSFTTP
jgi:hypothetical protein